MYHVIYYITVKLPYCSRKSSVRHKLLYYNIFIILHYINEETVNHLSGNMTPVSLSNFNAATLFHKYELILHLGFDRLDNVCVN